MFPDENLMAKEELVWQPKYTNGMRKKAVFKHFTKQGMENKKGKFARKIVRTNIRRGLELGKL